MCDIAIIVSSCDRYRATWIPFCHGFHKYWPDCRWPLMFVTNYLDAPCGQVIKTGRDDTWSKAIHKGLESLKSRVVLFLMDDYWLTERVDNKSLLQFARIVAQGHADYILLSSSSNTRKRDFALDPRLYVITEDSQYRAALQASLWNVEVFLNLLRNDESPWQFEISGSERSRVLADRFLSVKQDEYIRYTETGLSGYDQGPVVKGKWTPSAKIYVEHEGLNLDFSVNPDGTPNQTAQ